MAVTIIWKLGVGALLLGVIALSVKAPAPRQATPERDLRRLVGSALVLYGAGVAASLTHHATLACLVYACGIATSALAAWLSRGSDSGGPPDQGRPEDEEPPPQPDGIPPRGEVDWDALERALREAGERPPAGVA